MKKFGTYNNEKKSKTNYVTYLLLRFICFATVDFLHSRQIIRRVFKAFRKKNVHNTPSGKTKIISVHF